MTTTATHLADRPLVDVRSQPEDSRITTQLVYGEPVQVLETNTRKDQVLIESLRDGYKGHVAADSLRAPLSESTHRVVSGASLLLSEPDEKSPAVMPLYCGSELVITDTVDRRFARTEAGYFALRSDLLPLADRIAEIPWVYALRHFRGASYLWGGRSVVGIDCSALVQATARAIGMSIPRDSKDQEPVLAEITSDERKPSDLVYWPGHVALLTGRDTVFHANAYSMNATVEPLQAVIDRAGEPGSYRRMESVGKVG